MKASYLTSFVVILVVLCSASVAEAGSENVRKIIAGSAANGALRHGVCKIACAATGTV